MPLTNEEKEMVLKACSIALAALGEPDINLKIECDPIEGKAYSKVIKGGKKIIKIQIDINKIRNKLNKSAMLSDKTLVGGIAEEIRENINFVFFKNNPKSSVLSYVIHGI